VGVRIIYAAQIIAAGPPVKRLPRAMQSQAARDLLARIAARAEAVSSRSHSRTAIAVAATETPGVSIGIDIEWMAPERPVAAIAGSYLGAAASGLSIPEFYRAWTFYEAFFKAFQHAPSPALILEALSSSGEHTVCRLRDGISAIQHRVADGFQLSLVWSGGDCIPDYLGELVCD